MLWSIRARLKPALSVIELIPNVHRTPALTALRKAALDGYSATLRLSPDDKELAFFDGPVALISPIGARLLLALYREGRIKLKKPSTSKLLALEAYIATEAAFRAEVAVLIAEEDAKRARLAEIVADPSLAHPDEITPYLIDKVITAQFGHAAEGSAQIAGLTCHRSLAPRDEPEAQMRPSDHMLCWWWDAEGRRKGDVA
jgi:hypothetical protein